MNSFLLTLAGVVIAVLTLAFAVPHFIDWNSYRHVFEAQASKLVGRNVFVGGDVRLRLLPTPLLRFGEVRIADAKGQIDTPFIQAESFTIWLSTPPLLSGTFVAREIEIEKPIVNVKLNVEGQASWRGMGPGDAAVAFMPSEVALDSVKLTEATLSIIRGPSSAPINFENINGELSARSLQGPFKFTGRFNYEDRGRDIRFSTGRLQDDGALRLKSIIRATEGGEHIALDGELAEASSRPVLKGNLLAQFGTAKGAAGENAPLEVRSTIDVGLSRGRFDDLEITLRKNETPQVTRGRLDVGWLGGLEVTGTLSSRWLDLDSLAGAEDASPKGVQPIIAALLQDALRQSAVIARGGLQVAIDKVGLAGDAISDLSGQIDLDGGIVSVSNFSATLPGASQMTLAGRLGEQDGGPTFTGQLGLASSHLAQLLVWAGASSGQLSANEEAGFALDTAVQAIGQKLVLENAKGQLFGATYQGRLRYQGGAQPKFALNLTSEGLDFERLFGRDATVGSLMRLADNAESAEDAAGQSDAGMARWLAAGSADVDLQVAGAKLPGMKKADMAVKVSLANGNFSIDRLTLNSAEGLVLRAEGGLIGLAGKPRGRIMLTADAAAPEGIGSLWSALDLPGHDIALQRAEHLAPMRIAIAIESDREQADGLEIRVGGSLDNSNVELVAQYTGSIAEVDKGKFKLAGTLGNADGAALMRQLFPDLEATEVKTFEQQRGEMTLKADGEVSGSIATLAQLRVGELRWQLDGTTTAGEQSTKFSGTSDVSASDVEPFLSLAGLSLGPRTVRAPLSAKAGLTISDAAYRFSDIDGVLAGSKFSGSLSLENTGDTPLIRAAIEAEEVHVGQILRPLLSWRRASARREARRRPARRSPANRSNAAAAAASRWAERSFHMSAISNLQGNISLKAEKLILADALVMNQAELDVAMAEGKIDVSKLTGTWAGGNAKFSGVLQRREQGLSIDAQGRVEGIDLVSASALGSPRPLAEGNANLQLSVTGLGRTPKGLASSLSGAGTLAVSKGALHGFSPDALRKVAVVEVGAETFRARTLPARAAAAFEHAKFEVEPATIAIAIKDGVVQLGETVFDSKAGITAMTTYLELGSMKLDSEWTLAVKPRDEANEDLKIAIVFAGPVADFGGLEPKFGTKSLARHISVGRIARDLELKQLSEERRREAAEAAKQARAREAAEEAARQAAREAEAAAAQQARSRAAADEAARRAREQDAEATEVSRAAEEDRRAAEPEAAAPRQEPDSQSDAAETRGTRSETAAEGSTAAPRPDTTGSDQAAAREDAARPVPRQRTSRRPNQSSFEDSGFSGYNN